MRERKAVRVETSLDAIQHICGGCPPFFFFFETRYTNKKQTKNKQKKTKKGENMNTTKRITQATIGLAALVGTSCATLGHTVPKQQKYSSEEQVHAQLEAMTASGEFYTIAAYVHQQIDQHPDRYMNELYVGAKVALKHAPNGVFELAIDQSAEDVYEYMDARIYVMQQMQQHGGFSLNYTLDYDE